MSITALLRHVGVHVPRGIDVDGRVVLGASAGTPLARHTFHGGADISQLPGELAPWWLADPARRTADIVAVNRAFPRFSLNETDSQYLWQGVVNTGRGQFLVSVSARPDHQLPTIRAVYPRRLGRDEKGLFRRAPHLYDSGALCVADVSDWVPNQASVTAIAWAAHWLAAYTDWRLGGPWPTDGYQPHDQH